MALQTSTPPHLPTFNVRLTDKQIQGIVHAIFPNGGLRDVAQIERGKSFNNRIYFLAVTEQTKDTSGPILPLVMKVSGHYFGPSKVENEVGSLMLLRNSCPSVPTPDVVAWSEAGSTVNIPRHWSQRIFGNQEPALPIQLSDDLVSEHGWLMLTRLPGRSLTEDDLNGVHGGRLLKEVALCLTTLRQQVPAMPYCGNLRYVLTSDSANVLKDVGLDGLPFVIGGLIQSTSTSPGPLSSKAAFYHFKANDKLNELRTKAVLKGLRVSIEGLVEEFIAKLPSAAFLHDSHRLAVFTHHDFSPRNILVEGDANDQHISGLLDFEFATFCPVEEEFINASVRQPNDWPEPLYQMLLEEMEKAGCTTWRQVQDGLFPCGQMLSQACDCRDHQFQKLCILADVLEHIAPWWIQEGSMSDDELEVELRKCAEIVRKGIDALYL